MTATRYLIVSCAVALCAIGCGSEEPSATEASEPEVASTSGAEIAPAPVEEAPPPEPQEPAAAVTPPPPEMPKSAAMVTFKVKDFDAWKTAFDANEQARKDAGAVGHGISRDVAKGDTVSIWLPSEDPAQLEALYASPEMKAKAKESSIVGKITVSQMATAEMSPPTGGEMPKYGALSDQKVKDFEAWKVIFDGAAQARTDAGVLSHAVAQDPSDPNHVYVWLEGNDKDQLAAYLKSKELKARNKEAGVTGTPKTGVFENVEMKMYQ